MKHLSMLILIACILNVALLYSQTVRPHAPLTFSIDYSRFHYSDTSGYLEVSYAVYPYSVTFQKNRDTLCGEVVFKVVIRNVKNDSLVVGSSFSMSMNIGDTAASSMNGAYLGRTKHIIPNGLYELKVYGYDALDRSRRDSLHKSFSIDRYDSTVRISDVSLCSQIEKSDNKASPFYKNSYETIVNPGLVFGSNGKPVVFTYAEFYNLKMAVPYLVTAQIVDARNAIQKRRVRTKQYSVKNAVDVATLNVMTIPSGKYKFQLIFADTLGNEFARTEKQIFIYNPQVKQAAAATMSAKSVELAGLSDEELIDEFSKARYVAAAGDVNTFEKLQTKEARREFLAGFWAKIEKEQRGTTDLTRKIYLERVKFANERYSEMGKEGWRSDRGRVHCMQGDPDEIQRFPSLDTSKPYEIWNYNQIEGGIIFVFVDRFGIGNYMLMHSTMRGELQDESWQQYLQ
jgi:GWxTD domain-containing protein